MGGKNYTVTPIADADTERIYPALVGLNSKVFAISGIGLSTVSCYDIINDTWYVGYPKLNKTRFGASACVLGAKFYVFCGGIDYSLCKRNSIEKISESTLFPHSAARWELIEVRSNILSPRYAAGVAPLNEKEIVILGGDNVAYPYDVVVFNTISEEY